MMKQKTIRGVIAKSQREGRIMPDDIACDILASLASGELAHDVLKHIPDEVLEREGCRKVSKWTVLYEPEISIQKEGVMKTVCSLEKGDTIYLPLGEEDGKNKS